jgi:hypothetical protein
MTISISVHLSTLNVALSQISSILNTWLTCPSVSCADGVQGGPRPNEVFFARWVREHQTDW